VATKTGDERPAKANVDRAAYEQLVAKYSRHVYSVAYRLTGNDADAKDLAQEAYVRVWRAWGKIDPEARLEGWLYQIVKNLYIDLLRRRKGPKVYSLDEPMATAEGEVARDRPDPSADVERTVLDAGLDKRIQQALLELSPDLRMVVVLADIEGYGYEEIAEMIGVPIGTVKSRLHRARQALRGRLASVRSHIAEGA
jgi:RNA polymerase sigma-70 factor (ECF subfamily)